MKLFETQQIRELDAYTVEHEPISYLNLMERVAVSMTNWVMSHYSEKKNVAVFAGTGNNGGDALAMARQLDVCGFNVSVFLVNPQGRDLSSDCKTNFERLKTANRVSLHEVSCVNEIPEVERASEFIIEGLFGTGLSRSLDGEYEALVTRLNRCEKDIIAIDVPSGLQGNGGLIDKNSCAIHATHTLTLQVPKMAFMLPESSCFVGQFHILDIQIHPDGIAQTETPYFYTTKKDVPQLSKRDVFAHKGTFGHALFIGGSIGKMGAAIMATKACLRSGVGLMSALVPMCGMNIMQISVPEAMCVPNADNLVFSKVFPLAYESYDALAIGCGIGTEALTINALCALLPQLKKPIVLDADALNILAQRRCMFLRIPKNSILTPHPKEWQRIAGCSMNRWEQIQSARQFCKEHGLIVVLKGAYTAVVLPNGDVHFNSTGNPGMATGGSGDVLCGIILSLLAQGMDPADAAIRGVYLHGLAGDEAAKMKGMTAMLATDIVDCLTVGDDL